MPNRPIPPDVPVGLDVSVTTGADCNPSDDVFVTLFVDGEAKRRERATALAPGSSAAMQLLLPPLSKDRHRIRVELQPDDPLSVDNVRYGCVEVAEPPTVAVVAETSTSPVLNTGDVLANMLAPAALPLSRQRLRIERHSPGECDDLDWSRFRGVLLANVAALGTRAWHELADFTQQGGTVVCVLGDAVSVDRYDEAGGLLPALPTRIVTDTEPAHLVVCDAQNALARPLLSPALAPLELRQIYRRWSVKPADKGVTPIVSFSDGAPAILVREIGRGRCILLALSPDAAWSDLAAHAAPLLVFLQEAFAQAARASEGTGNALVGSTAIVGLESLGGAASAPLEAFFASVAQSPSRLDIPLTGARALLPTDRPGHVLVRARGQAEPGYLLAVNVATAETALTRVDSAKLAWVASGNTASQPVPAPPEGAGVASTSRRIDLLVPAALLALALIIAESAFANRIYKNSPAAAARERPGNLTT
jgi:hypothetical protein